MRRRLVHTTSRRTGNLNGMAGEDMSAVNRDYARCGRTGRFCRSSWEECTAKHVTLYREFNA